MLAFHLYGSRGNHSNTYANNNACKFIYSVSDLSASQCVAFNHQHICTHTRAQRRTRTRTRTEQCRGQRLYRFYVILVHVRASVRTDRNATRAYTHSACAGFFSLPRAGFQQAHAFVVVVVVVSCGILIKPHKVFISCTLLRAAGLHNNACVRYTRACAYAEQKHIPRRPLHPLPHPSSTSIPRTRRHSNPLGARRIQCAQI